MARRYYSNTANKPQLSGAISAGATSMTVGAATGWPSNTPFWAIIARSTASAEVVEVTGVAGSTWTIVRGQDGTIASAHNSGDYVEHIIPAKHANDAEVHQDATSAVHGVTGDLVGTTDNQTITNKLYRGAGEHRFSDAQPAAPAAGFEVEADAALARPGFLWNNTGAATGAAFQAQVSGVDKALINSAGNLVAKGTTTEKVIQVQDGGVEKASITAAGTVTTTGAISTTSTVTATGAITSSGALSGASASISGAATAGSVSAGTAALTSTSAQALNVAANSTGTAARVHIETKSDTRGLEVTDGTNDLFYVEGDGDVVYRGNLDVTLTAGTPTTAKMTLRAQSTQAALTVRDSGGSNKFSVQADGHIDSAGVMRAYSTGVPVLAVVEKSSVSSPATNQIVFEPSSGFLWRWNGSAWRRIVPAAYSSATRQHARYVNTNSPSTTVASSTDVTATFPTARNTSSLVVASGTNNTTFTLGPAGVWDIKTGWRGSAGTTAAELRLCTSPQTTLPNTLTTGSGHISAFTAFEGYLAAGTAIQVGWYHGTGSDRTVAPGFGDATFISFTYRGMEE